jgi:site-specific DNA recombinase
MSREYAALRANRRSEGLWPLSAEPGPSFRWGAITRRSAFTRRKVRDEHGAERTVLVEESRHRQEGTIYEHVKRNGLGVIVGVYSEIVSAYKANAKRVEYENALDDLRAGRIDGLIVWKLDRLTRRRSEKRRILNVLEECGGRLYSIVEGLDTADPEKAKVTEIALSLYVGSAEDESASIGERVALMHLDRAKKGLVQRSSVRPFGHTEDCRALVPAEVEILHEAARRLFAGEASFSIAADFTAREIPKPSGKTNWNSYVLRRMLTNARLVGRREYGGNLYELEGVPSIFDQETWEKLCAVLAKRGARSGPVESHLLSSIALCGICKRTLSSATSGRKSVKTYVCRPRFEGDEACRKISVSLSHAEARVTALVVEWLADKERVRKLLLRQAPPDLVAKIQAREAELATALHDLSKARFNPPPGVKRMMDETFYELAAEIEAERKENGRSLAVTREANRLNEVLQFEDAAHEWQTRPLHWKREILKLVTESIVIEPRGKLLPRDDPRFRPGFNGFDPDRVQITFADEG